MQLFSMSYLFMFNWATDVLILTGLFDIEDRIGARIIFYVIVLIMPLATTEQKIVRASNKFFTIFC